MTQVPYDPFGPVSSGRVDPWANPSAWPGYLSTTNRANTNQPPFSTGGQAAQIGPQTAQTNLAASAQNTQLADLINSVNQAAQQAANASRLGPQGQQIQNLLLENTQAGAAGVLDPTTEQMLRMNIAQRFGSKGIPVDSPALYSAYTRATGGNIATNEQQALDNYMKLLAANPSAPIFNMGELIVPPSVYSQTAQAEASRQQQAQQFAMNYALQQAELQAQNQRAADQLAYQYAALGSRGGGGPGGGGVIPSAAAYNTRLAPTETGFSGAGVNPFSPYDQYYPQTTTGTTGWPEIESWNVPETGTADWYYPSYQEPDYGLPSELWYDPYSLSSTFGTSLSEIPNNPVVTYGAEQNYPAQDYYDYPTTEDEVYDMWWNY